MSHEQGLDFIQEALCQLSQNIKKWVKNPNGPSNIHNLFQLLSKNFLNIFDQSQEECTQAISQITQTLANLKQENSKVLIRDIPIQKISDFFHKYEANHKTYINEMNEIKFIQNIVSKNETLDRIFSRIILAMDNPPNHQIQRQYILNVEGCLQLSSTFNELQNIYFNLPYIFKDGYHRYQKDGFYNLVIHQSKSKAKSWQSILKPIYQLVLKIDIKSYEKLGKNYVRIKRKIKKIIENLSDIINKHTNKNADTHKEINPLIDNLKKLIDAIDGIGINSIIENNSTLHENIDKNQKEIDGLKSQNKKKKKELNQMKEQQLNELFETTKWMKEKHKNIIIDLYNFRDQLINIKVSTIQTLAENLNKSIEYLQDFNNSTTSFIKRFATIVFLYLINSERNKMQEAIDGLKYTLTYLFSNTDELNNVIYCAMNASTLILSAETARTIKSYASALFFFFILSECPDDANIYYDLTEYESLAFMRDGGTGLSKILSPIMIKEDYEKIYESNIQIK